MNAQRNALEIKKKSLWSAFTVPYIRIILSIVRIEAKLEEAHFNFIQDIFTLSH